MLNGIKRLVRKIFKIPISKSERNGIFLKKLTESKSFSGTKVNNGLLFANYKNKYPIVCRLWPHSDLLVLDQVLVRNEYFSAIDLIKVNLALKEVRIIDAGANVGYSSIYFLSEFPLSTIACVEPDDGNFQILERNLELFKETNRVFLFKNALMGIGDRNMMVSNEFRDQKDWSVTTTETKEETGLKSVSIPQVMAQMKWEFVDLLKMDIEGAERYIFNPENDISFLNKIRVCCIEIHDEFDTRDEIYDLLLSKGFLITNFGETTFAINKHYFSVS